jgi:tRNA pseudouridine55 synthase
MMRDGLLLIDKGTGLTSHDVVARVRRLVRQKKTGHCGTLDPNATGLLLLTLGKATRLTRFLIRAPKVYTGEVRFGAATDTYDAMGEVVEERPLGDLSRQTVAQAMAGFEGDITHAAPPYSAKKVDGKKLYELARKGEEVPEKTKEVTIYEYSPQGELEDGVIAFRLACESGTYARTLAHDLGHAVGTLAHLESLRRVQIGPFDLDRAATLERLTELVDAAKGREPGDGSPSREEPPAEPTEGWQQRLAQSLGTAWVPFDQIPLPFATLTTDLQQEQRIVHGQTVLARELDGDEGDWVRVTNRQSELIAVGTIVERIGERGVGIVQPKVVFKT